MRFMNTQIEGVRIIQREPVCDERGYFCRLYCEKEFCGSGITESFCQVNICENKKRGTLRGLHYQKNKGEDKAVACTRGKIFDVCVDIRPDSPTYKKYVGVELSECNQKMLYIPKGCAHGYVTLEDDTQLIYLMSEFYQPGLDGGYRYDDPAFAINWPMAESLIISDRDRNLPYISKGGNIL